MPNAVESWRSLKEIVDQAWADKRVVPPVPPSRRSTRPRSDEAALKDLSRSKASSWSAFIQYTDRTGQESCRRITATKIWRQVGGNLVIGAFCHEAGAYREFRPDRMREMVDCQTGECLDPIATTEGLKRSGLPFTDRGMEALAKILVFMTRCDGHAHPLEYESIDRALTSYALRCDGETEDVELALATSHRLAPDGTDFALALKMVLRSPPERRKMVADICGRACGDVVHADGHLHDAELHWGNAVDECLRIIRG
ncbi:hypothetical protein [Allosphingosinicella indica]|uniref:TerB family tellurite resistance protein n=1 Tax=Allosphingosinicella indica TaxID=941907 RepID=A0A1X7GL22_9SPHN|nr:hypothetical protein [Allosphingosinicella indica]SMF70667.1 hypothetical protein SAMN06295910_1925 [Allosphingosinicella indica]